MGSLFCSSAKPESSQIGDPPQSRHHKPRPESGDDKAPPELSEPKTMATKTLLSDESDGNTCKKTVPQSDPKHPGTHDNNRTGTNQSEQQAERENSGLSLWTALGAEEERRREHRRDMDRFVINAAKAYEEMLKNMQIRCRSEAEKHDIDAASYQRICHNLETVGRVLGAVSLAGVVRFMVKWFSSSTKENVDADTNLTSIGLLAFSGVAITGVLQFLSKGSARLFSTFKMRANEHRIVTIGWQLLKLEIEATRIGLRNPEVDLKEAGTMYKEHIAKHKELSAQILVSEQTSDRIKSIEEEKSFLDQWPDDPLRRDGPQ
ncbi:uncharacterized protein [Littorina saxatilis]|uniref:uncharacterized protein isoform X2 n=1 Tax=Littorina saxatilis TaxID=31220 RepID=UPI0038B58C8B